VLEAFAAADQNLPKSLQVALTYPFIDEAVGRDPESPATSTWVTSPTCRST
jgi:hypothetical protein